jgi:hypothetical protein
MSPFRQRVLAVFGSLALFFTALETIPRYVDIPGLNLKSLDPIRRILKLSRVGPHPYMAYSPKPNFTSPEGDKHVISHNSLGFRGPEITEEKPDGVFRIICLGGSSTYGHGPTSNETTWPYRLQTRLSKARPDLEIQVINGGCQGYTSYESLANLAFRGLALEPDVVVVYHAINDMRGALYENIKSDNTHRRAVFKRIEKNWIDNSWTYLTLRAYLTSYTKRSKDLGSWVITDYNERQGKDSFRWTSDKGFDNFERNLNSIISLANSNGAKVVLGTQAMKISTMIGRASREDQLKGFYHANELVRKTAEARKALLCDLGPEVTKAGLEREEAGKSPTLFTSEVHVTNFGADLIALEFAKTILRSKLLPENPKPAQKQ